jgi:hypothetical protein
MTHLCFDLWYARINARSDFFLSECSFFDMNNDHICCMERVERTNFLGMCVCGANSVSRTLQHAKKVASRMKQQADFMALFRRFYNVFRFSELTFLTLITIPYVPWCVRESSLVCVQLFWVIPYKCE